MRSKVVEIPSAIWNNLNYQRTNGSDHGIMDKTVICEKVLMLGEREQCTLTYYLISDECGEEEAALRQYGVGIAIPERSEEELICDITPNSEKAMRLLDLLASNFVTPVALRDVLYDWLCT